MNLSDVEIKKYFLDNVPKVGSIEETRKALEIPYSKFRELEVEDRLWASEIKQAEDVWSIEFNRKIGHLAKVRLYDILQKGVIEKTVTKKYIDDPNARRQAREEGLTYTPVVEITKKEVHKGVPIQAIIQGLAMIPGLVKALEEMARYDTIEASKAKEVQTYLEQVNDGLAAILTDDMKEKLNELSDQDIVGNLQSVLLGNKGN